MIKQMHHETNLARQALETFEEAYMKLNWIKMALTDIREEFSVI